VLADLQTRKNKSLVSHKIKKVIISGGGTGGHIFPAIAIANAIKKRNVNVEILFVGASDRMEMQKVPEAGYPIVGLWIAGYQRGQILNNLLLCFKILSSIIRSFLICKNHKPDIVIGVGGYASAPLLYVASKLGIPSLIQEQNSYAGITNKLLGSSVDKICVAYDNMNRFFPSYKIILTGNPIRKDIQDVSNVKQEAISHFKLSSDKKTVLVIGGSLGARSINQAIEHHLEEFKALGVQLIWQTGKAYYGRAKKACDKLNTTHIKAVEFIKKMNYAYAVSDVVISRAGALSISELCVVKKACVLIPSPNVSEDHQKKNALALVERKAALMIEDKDVVNNLMEVLNELISSPELQSQLKENIKALSIVDADERIVNEIEELVS
jgi:UDP-N-acetylglucosamine--N-acetylmuramyl-(pentapeptide) pyrophosphoryl-undecaprenol N-acetylglucosamine transferase